MAMTDQQRRSRESAAAKQFHSSTRPHILNITNHGLHEWRVTPGLPDTGGQNIYVNQFTEALIELGYRVTIVNRGGYPNPKTGEMHRGVAYHDSGEARVVYIEDGYHEFVRKEDMNDQLDLLALDLIGRLDADGDHYDMIISHYWDAGKLGNALNHLGKQRVSHVWVPHSLGALKKRNMPPETYADLRIDERIAHEKVLLREIDAVVATSSAIRDTLRNDYGYDPHYFMPPCIDESRNHPRGADEVAPIYDFLAEHSPLSADQIRQRKIVTEVSRTDVTKRKSVLLKAFAEVRRQVPESLCVVTIDPSARELYGELSSLIYDLAIHDDVIVLGSVWEQLPLIYAATHVYCTPSVMEGFGMTAQEAAATGVPAVASDLVPFVVEYLAGDKAAKTTLGSGDQAREVLLGEAGIVCPHDDVPAFTQAVVHLLQDDELRQRMGARAREITIPYFTWKNMASGLLEKLGKGSDVEWEQKAPGNRAEGGQA